MELCGKELCTGCGACMEMCMKDCIYYDCDEYGTKYARIDVEKCVNCGMCLKACHIGKQLIFRLPLRVYAAWSANKERHSQAASGGIATEIYRYALQHDIFIMGTCFDREKGVFYREIRSENDIKWARDSKYVYSDMSPCFCKYEEQLLQKRKCIFIGLPCQVSALNTFLEERRLDYKDNLLCVDIICHGVPNWQFLDEHLRKIETRKKTTVRKVTFRNPDSRFLLCCYNTEDNLIYRKRMHANDAYYRAFEVNLDFRDGCYQCRYARSERISDLTIGDYSGLGKLWDYSGCRQQVSVLIVSSKSGQKLIDCMAVNGLLDMVERPLFEPASAPGNPQLRHPVIPHKNRKLFLKCYKETQNFEKSVTQALFKLFLEYYLSYPIKYFRSKLVSILPVQLKNKIKKLLEKG